MPRSLSWKTVERIRARWRRPFFIKGILHPVDVQLALDSGVDGVILGSHGGRQLDGSLCALDVVRQARKIADGKMSVALSGGIRRGTDMLKVLALGSDFVLCGRAPLYGLCAAGDRGVTKALQILMNEAENAMGQIGASSLADLRPDILRRAHDS
ncbi:alpha-hydroxy-acid oxidizing protein [Sphingobium sp. RSMS]|uniref:alpha-hydroxy acid oxidase n=1 Tax=Sphingobium sp. RSMS TaxID=520734 RepID=UPI0010F81A6B|nr:alpha-hydroxy acid oxidase [Sphingobium sp. RSMS]UXC91484.1 alpha-hydroxy-acid oxidizing protein [Sphingobium sp. RSMS]